MASSKEENYEHVLMCLICRSLFDDFDHQPKFLPCHHTFCKDCLREYIRQMGDEIECPSCRKIANIPAAGVTALQTNFYVKYIQSLVQGRNGLTGAVKDCQTHDGEQLQYYCFDCQLSVCTKCCDKSHGACVEHKRAYLTSVTEESHQKLDTAFSAANTLIESKKVKLETLLKALSEEKDQALIKIESTFEQHIHTMNRRATLLKNKVIDIYNEHVEKLESDIMEISTAMTCIVSLKDYHEDMISGGDFKEVERGISEINEVHSNISERIRPSENHIVFEEKHGTDKFKACAKDLGRVRCSRPIPPRVAPEGNDSETVPGVMQATAIPTAAVTASATTPTADELFSPDEEQHSFASGVPETDSEPTTPGLWGPNTQVPQSEVRPMNVAHSTPTDGATSSQSFPVAADLQSAQTVSLVRPDCQIPADKLPDRDASVASDGFSDKLDLNGNARRAQMLANAASACDTQTVSKPRSTQHASTSSSTEKPSEKARNVVSKHRAIVQASSSTQTTRSPVHVADTSRSPVHVAETSQTSIQSPGQPQVDAAAPPSSNLQITPPQNDAACRIQHPVEEQDAGAAVEENEPLQCRDDDPNSLNVDKHYYSLVYTSYDEEELLKELKAGNVPGMHPGLEAAGIQLASDRS